MPGFLQEFGSRILEQVAARRARFLIEIDLADGEALSRTSGAGSVEIRQD
jgi:hypothetical protein